MKKSISVLLVVVALASCSPKKTWEAKNIETKEKALSDKSHMDTTALNELIDAYQAYANKYPADTLGAEYLFKAADYYRYLHKPVKSIALYKNIYNSYPTSAKRPYALVLQGFTYENEMGKLDSAKAKYLEFLNVYPTHPIAKDVQTTVANLGKTPEQLISEFEERQHADSLQKASK